MTDRNPLDFPNSARMADFGLNILRLFSIMPKGWVFLGVMRRPDVAYGVVPDAVRWAAVATLESPTELGPVPEIRGYGKDMVAALVELRVQIAEEFGIDDPTGYFGEDSLTTPETPVESSS